MGWDHPFTQAGLLASIALSVLSIFSIRPLREAGYEFFVVIHFLLVLLVFRLACPLVFTHSPPALLS